MALYMVYVVLQSSHRSNILWISIGDGHLISNYEEFQW